MTLLPIVERELKVAARRPSSYWVRWWVALGAFVLFFFFSTGANSPSASALPVFLSMSVLVFLFTLMAGVWLTADALSVEKREETLGLLFLTDLKAYDIVLGKLAAAAVPAFFAILAVIPMLCISIVLGGVAWTEVVRIAGALAVTLVFSLTAGLAVSAFVQEARTASVGTGLLIGAFALFGAYSIVAPYANRIFPSPAPSWLYSWSPTACLWLGFDTQYAIGKHARLYWQSLAQVLGTSALFLVLAQARLPFEIQRRKAERGPGRWRRWFQKRHLLLDNNPVVWLSSHDPALHVLAWAAAVLMCPIVLCLVWIEWKGPFMSGSVPIVCMALAVIAHLLIKWLAAEMSCRRLSRDRASGALELLMTTPLNEASFLSDLRQGLWNVMLRPMFFIGTCDAFMLCMTIHRGKGSSDSVIMILVVAALIFGFWTDFFALSRLGQYRALRAKSPNRALAGTLTIMVGVPWVSFVVVLFVNPPMLFGWLITFCLIMPAFIADIVNDRLSKGLGTILNLR